MLREMEAAGLINDFVKIRKIAHQMKPSIDNLNVVSIKQLIRDIENASADNMDNTVLFEKLDTLKKIILNVISNLKAEYPG